MTRGTITTREYYLACRRDNGVRESLRLTAEYKGMSTAEVAETLGIAEITEDVYCKFEGCETRLPTDYAKRFAYCPKHLKGLLE